MLSFIITVFSFFFIFINISHACRTGTWCSWLMRGDGTQGCCSGKATKGKRPTVAPMGPTQTVIQITGKDEGTTRKGLRTTELPPLPSLAGDPSGRGRPPMTVVSSLISSRYRVAPLQTEGDVDESGVRDETMTTAAADSATGDTSPLEGIEKRLVLRDTILLADDTPVQLRLATHQINRKFSSHALWTAANPDQVRELCQRGFPHLMVLDNSMPDRNAGLNLARWVRSIPGGEKVTIFLWTSDDAHYFDAAELTRLNITYVAKPELRVALEGYLTRLTPAA